MSNVIPNEIYIVNVENFGTRLRESRRSKGWSRKELARQSGVAEEYLWLLENRNRMRAAREKLQKIAEALSVTVEFLLGQKAAYDGALIAAPKPKDGLYRVSDGVAVRVDIAEKAYLAFDEICMLTSYIISQTVYGQATADIVDGPRVVAPTAEEVWDVLNKVGDIAAQQRDLLEKAAIAPKEKVIGRMTDRYDDILTALRQAKDITDELFQRIVCVLLAPDGAKVEQSPLNGAWLIYEPRSYGKDPFCLWQGYPSDLDRLQKSKAWADAAFKLVDLILPSSDFYFQKSGEKYGFRFDNNTIVYAPTPALAVLTALFEALTHNGDRSP